MSKKVIHDLVLPIVLRRLQKMGVNYPSYAVIHDEALEEYFEEELLQNFSIRGQNGKCEELEERIKEALERNSEAFEQYIAFLLEKYINLKTTLLAARKIKPPPDRFKDLREKAKDVFRVKVA